MAAFQFLVVCCICLGVCLADKMPKSTLSKKVNYVDTLFNAKKRIKNQIKVPQDPLKLSGSFDDYFPFPAVPLSLESLHVKEKKKAIDRKNPDVAAKLGEYFKHVPKHLQDMEFYQDVEIDKETTKYKRKHAPRNDALLNGESHDQKKNPLENISIPDKTKTATNDEFLWENENVFHTSSSSLPIGEKSPRSKGLVDARIDGKHTPKYLKNIKHRGEVKVHFHNKTKATLWRKCTRRLHNCSLKPNRVCGDDGKTYFNKCHLRRQACKNGGPYSIKVVHRGKCQEI